VNNQQASQVTTGLLVVLIGLLLLAGQLDRGWEFGRLWPLIFVVLGVSRFLTVSEDGSRGDGFWFLFLGGIFLLHSTRILRLSDSWPLFVVAAGVALMFGDRHRRSASKGPKAGPEGKLS
jgi:hypothetical protein